MKKYVVIGDDLKQVKNPIVIEIPSGWSQVMGQEWEKGDKYFSSVLLKFVTVGEDEMDELMGNYICVIRKDDK